MCAWHSAPLALPDMHLPASAALIMALQAEGSAAQLELTKEIVALAHGALAFAGRELRCGLAALGGGEGRLFDGGDGRVAGDHNGHYTTLGLNTERQ